MDNFFWGQLMNCDYVSSKRLTRPKELLIIVLSAVTDGIIFRQVVAPSGVMLLTLFLVGEYLIRLVYFGHPFSRISTFV